MLIVKREIEICFLEAVNAVINSDATESRKKNMLVLIIYLRMATAHPFLLEGVLSGVLEEKNILSIQRQLREIGGKRPVYEQIGIQARDFTRNNVGASSFGKSMFGSHFQMHRQLDVALAVRQQRVCRICLDTLEEPQRTSVSYLDTKLSVVKVF